MLICFFFRLFVRLLLCFARAAAALTTILACPSNHRHPVVMLPNLYAAKKMTVDRMV